MFVMLEDGELRASLLLVMPRLNLLAPDRREVIEAQLQISRSAGKTKK